MKELGTVEPEQNIGAIKTLQYVPGVNANSNIFLQDNYDPLRDDQVWVGTESRKIMIYSAQDPERGRVLGSSDLPTEILSMAFHAEAVWVGLADGQIAVFRRNVFNLAWDLISPQLIDLGSQDPVLSLLPMNGGPHLGLYAACGKRVWVIDVNTNETVRSFNVQPRGVEATCSGPAPPTAMFVHQMAQSGVGLWLALRHSATICLYHTETFRHLQDINIASNVSRVLAARDVSRPQRSIHVTALMASRGLLWVGTNVGIALTVPLPRLEGVPIISGRANISYHAHFGSVTFFLNLQHKVLTTEVQQSNSCPNSSENNQIIQEESEKDLELELGELNVPDEEQKNSLKKKFSDSVLPSASSLISSSAAAGTNSSSGSVTTKAEDNQFHEKNIVQQQPETEVNKINHQQNAQTLPPGTKLRHRNSSPILRRRPQITPANAAQQMSRRSSKTLPRGFSLANAANAGDSLDCDVFGLYGELLNVRDYDCDSGERISMTDELRKSDPELSTIPYRYTKENFNFTKNYLY